MLIPTMKLSTDIASTLPFLYPTFSRPLLRRRGSNLSMVRYSRVVPLPSDGSAGRDADSSEATQRTHPECARGSGETLQDTVSIAGSQGIASMGEREGEIRHYAQSIAPSSCDEDGEQLEDVEDVSLERSVESRASAGGSVQLDGPEHGGFVRDPALYSVDSLLELEAQVNAALGTSGIY